MPPAVATEPVGSYVDFSISPKPADDNASDTAFSDGTLVVLTPRV